MVQVSGPSDFSGSQTSSGCDKRVEIFRRESFRVLDAEQDGAAAEKSVRRFRTRGFGERGRVQEVQSEEVPEEILVGAGFEEGGRGDEGRRAILLGFHPHGSLAGPNPVEQFLLVSGASAWLWLLAEHKAARSAEQAVSLASHRRLPRHGAPQVWGCHRILRDGIKLHHCGVCWPGRSSCCAHWLNVEVQELDLQHEVGGPVPSVPRWRQEGAC